MAPNDCCEIVDRVIAVLTFTLHFHNSEYGNVLQLRCAGRESAETGRVERRMPWPFDSKPLHFRNFDRTNQFPSLPAVIEMISLSELHCKLYSLKERSVYTPPVRVKSDDRERSLSTPSSLLKLVVPMPGNRRGQKSSWPKQSSAAVTKKIGSSVELFPLYSLGIRRLCVNEGWS